MDAFTTMCTGGLVEHRKLQVLPEVSARTVTGTFGYCWNFRHPPDGLYIHVSSSPDAHSFLFALVLSAQFFCYAVMASLDSKDSPPRRNEKRSKTNQDRATASSSRPMRTKAACAVMLVVPMDMLAPLMLVPVPVSVPLLLRQPLHRGI